MRKSQNGNFSKAIVSAYRRKSPQFTHKDKSPGLGLYFPLSGVAESSLYPHDGHACAGSIVPTAVIIASLSACGFIGPFPSYRPIARRFG